MDILIKIAITLIVLIAIILIDIFYISKIEFKMIWLLIGISATLVYMLMNVVVVDHIAPVIVAYSIFKLYRK